MILARESDKKQDSNEAQVGRLDSYIKLKQFSPVEIYQIKESSTKADRKLFDEIIEKIRQSKEIIAFVVDTIDRMQRSFKESVILDDLRREGKVEIHFYRENLIINKDSNSADLLRWDMGVMFARSYVLQLSDNVKRKIEQKIRNGEWIGKAHYGYRNITKENDKKDIIIDEFTSKIVKKLYELYATGAYSFLLIKDKMKKDYDLDFSKGFLDCILKNPFYYGQMVVKGKLYPHKYETVISKELFDRVQEIKAGYNKKHFKFAGLPYAYRGLIRCEACNCMVTPEKHKGLIYYHCTQYHGKHNAEWLREEEITKQFAKVFKKIQIPDHVLEDILGTLKSVHQGKSEFRQKQAERLNAEKEKYASRIEQMYLDKLDSRITVDEYDRLYKDFRQKIASIDYKLTNLQQAEDNYYLTAKYLLELANRAYDLFMSSEIEEKRQLLKLTLQNLKLNGKTVQYEAIKPFDKILFYASRSKWLRGAYSVRTYFNTPQPNFYLPLLEQPPVNYFQTA